MIKITGTLIKNYFHCKRQSYLYYYGLNFKNEFTRIGHLMHKEVNANERIFEKIKVDDIQDDTIIEFKKTSSNMKGTKFQVLYYLKYFKDRGVNLKGVIKDMTYKQDYKVILDEQSEKELDKSCEDIRSLLSSGYVPAKLSLKKNCRHCSFFDYCWS